MKQVIVVNQALDLPPGKMAAQVAHGAVGGFLQADREQQVGWLQKGMPKIILRCVDEAALLDLHAQAEAAGVPTLLVRDAGRTVLEPGTATCVGIGPDTPARVDAITATLKLVR